MFEMQYSQEMDEWLRENYNKGNKKEITKIFNEKFKAERTVWALSSRAHLLGITTKIAEKRKKIYIGFNIDEIKRKAIRKKINGYKLKKFYKNFVLYEKTLENGETLRKTYTYWDLSRIV